MAYGFCHVSICEMEQRTPRIDVYAIVFDETSR